MISSLYIYGLSFVLDGKWQPYNYMNLTSEVRECSPVFHIQWLIDNSEALTEETNFSDDDDEECYISRDLGICSHYDTESEIYNYVDELVNYDKLVLQERQMRYPHVHVNSAAGGSFIPTFNPIQTFQRNQIRLYAETVASLFSEANFNSNDW